MVVIGILLIIVCIGIAVAALKPKKTAEPPRVIPEEPREKLVISPDFKTKETIVATRDSGNPGNTNKINNGTSIYVYTARRDIWVCSNCEAENDLGSYNCCVCFRHR